MSTHRPKEDIAYHAVVFGNSGVGQNHNNLFHSKPQFSILHSTYKFSHYFGSFFTVGKAHQFQKCCHLLKNKKDYCIEKEQNEHDLSINSHQNTTLVPTKEQGKACKSFMGCPIVYQIVLLYSSMLKKQQKRFLQFVQPKIQGRHLLQQRV